MNTKAKLDEWLKGDFSKRELHQKAERIKAYYRKLDEEKSTDEAASCAIHTIYGEEEWPLTMMTAMRR